MISVYNLKWCRYLYTSITLELSSSSQDVLVHYGPNMTTFSHIQYSNMKANEIERKYLISVEVYNFQSGSCEGLEWIEVARDWFALYARLFSYNFRIKFLTLYIAKNIMRAELYEMETTRLSSRPRNSDYTVCMVCWSNSWIPRSKRGHWAFDLYTLDMSLTHAHCSLFLFIILVTHHMIIVGDCFDVGVRVGVKFSSLCLTVSRFMLGHTWLAIPQPEAIFSL